MPDFVVHKVKGESLAVYACRYVLTRVARDPNIAHYVLHSGVMESCIAGLAEATGKSEEEIKKVVLDAASHNRQPPDVVRLREDVSRLESRIDELVALGHVDDGLRNRRDDQADWQAARDRALCRIEEHLHYVRLGVVDLDADVIEDALHPCQRHASRR